MAAAKSSKEARVRTKATIETGGLCFTIDLGHDADSETLRHAAQSLVQSARSTTRQVRRCIRDDDNEHPGTNDEDNLAALDGAEALLTLADGILSHADAIDRASAGHTAVGRERSAVRPPATAGQPSAH